MRPDSRRSRAAGALLGEQQDGATAQKGIAIESGLQKGGAGVVSSSYYIWQLYIK
eukprot:SAG22_NODE_235_length_14319_cov_3.248805_1_plen_55_part_00